MMMTFGMRGGEERGKKRVCVFFGFSLKLTSALKFVNIHIFFSFIQNKA